MAQYKIGTVQFDLIERDPQPPEPREANQLLTRPGIDYTHSIGQGKRGVPVEWSGCIKICTNSAAAQTFLEELDAIEGHLVDVYDGWEHLIEDVLVMDVGNAPAEAVIYEGNNRVRVRRTVRLMKMR